MSVSMSRHLLVRQLGQRQTFTAGRGFARLTSYVWNFEVIPQAKNSAPSFHLLMSTITGWDANSVCTYPYAVTSRLGFFFPLFRGIKTKRHGVKMNLGSLFQTRNQPYSLQSLNKTPMSAENSCRRQFGADVQKNTKQDKKKTHGNHRTAVAS